MTKDTASTTELTLARRTPQVGRRLPGGMSTPVNFPDCVDAVATQPLVSWKPL